MTTLRERPEAPWALWAGIAGLLAATALMVKAIFSSASSTAAVGFIFVPLLAALAAAATGIWGLALGHVVARLRGAVRDPWIVFAAALVAAASLPAAVGYEIWRGTRLEHAVAEVSRMDGRGLERAFAESPWKRDKFFLAAIAQNPHAGAGVLDAIAGLDDPELFEPLGSLWNVLVDNRKGMAVMRLVAHHRNTAAATLAGLEAHPLGETVLHEVLANPNTPVPILEKHAASASPTAHWGLALNPNAPRAVLERLSRSADLYTRLNLTYNEAVPSDLLQRLAQDADPYVARNARQALEKRR